MRARKRIDRAKELGRQPDQADIELDTALSVRKDRLKAIYSTHVKPSDITAGHVIAAIKELNLMEHVYDETPFQDNRTFNLIVTPETAELMSGVEKRLKGGNDAIQGQGSTEESEPGSESEA